MTCPACDHTMAKVADDLWHCPRCGTLISNLSINGIVPELVERCRQLRQVLSNTYLSWFRKLGIAESIDKPENRK